MALLALAGLASACSSSENAASTSDRYWNVVMAGNSTATLTFGTPVANAIVTGATLASTIFNFKTSGGAATCQVIGSNATIVFPGGKTGTINFNGNCMGQMTSDLVITLGNTTTAILDTGGNTIVSGGSKSEGRITPAGAQGATTGNVTY